MDNISVVVRSRNEEQHIGYCLQSITDFIGKPEIILVDNQSTDNTIRIVNSFEYHNIKKMSISNNHYTPGRALNMGISEATGDYIIILSAHCQITSLDLKNVITKLNDESTAAVWGKQIPIMYGKRIGRRYMWSNFKDENQTNYFSKPEDRYFFHNAFSFFKGDFIKKNLFDERYAGKEDRYWAIDMINNGNNILYDSDSVVNHFYTKNGATWKGIG
jgi:glycosyltransferase involved in cell wall biosynthesis|tara:strand:+ start:904 stop:1554 length:651 start_codon:yes stop_codon:yes gene_type:complete